MVAWQYTLSIKDIMQRYDVKRNESIPDIGKCLSERITKFLNDNPSFPLSDAEKLKSISKSLSNARNTKKINNCLNRLYGIGDEDHILWIEGPM